MLPPTRPPTDPYDVPASPVRAKEKKDAVDSPSESSRSALARDSDRTNDAAVTAVETPPKKKDPANGFVNSPKVDATEKKSPKKKAEEVSADAEETPADKGSTAAANAEPGELEVESFEAHRVDESQATVDILVKWAGGEKTWETEWSLQHQVPTLVFQYWDNLDGREAATGLDIYHVFRILKRATPPKAKKNRYMYQVQWVGYRRTDATWEHESKIKEIAPDELIKFEAKNGAASDAPPQKRVGGRGPGRPRKKPKVAEE
ncbi:hypothetical protein AK830_g11066 [Neonectria ditissima]|uniref:Chromo domain-containing protein n=1 Tax=Neonectria ditissima TaxID=78410 RepID=A0A0P7B924_9HYPO|nr:hypothetical protein AK830_g11066 [Neonectria ditissima]